MAGRARTPSETSAARSSRESLARIGPFFVDARETPEQHLERLAEIAPWFTRQRVDEYLTPMITQRARVSLRVLDWFVTNYCRSSPTFVGGVDGYHCISTIYKICLRQWRRELFDPFRRRARVLFFGDDQYHETTCAQLNFLHWAETHGVRRQAELRVASVEQEMISALKRSRSDDEPEQSRRRRVALAQEERCQVFLLGAPLRLDLSPREQRS